MQHVHAYAQIYINNLYLFVLSKMLTYFSFLLYRLRGVEIPAHVFDKENGNSNKYPRGACLALPANANSVLMINPENDEVVTFGDPEIIYKGGWKW